jgi:hypothetical protein
MIMKGVVAPIPRRLRGRLVPLLLAATLGAAVPVVTPPSPAEAACYSVLGVWVRGTGRSQTLSNDPEGSAFAAWLWFAVPNAATVRTVSLTYPAGGLSSIEDILDIDDGTPFNSPYWSSRTQGFSNLDIQLGTQAAVCPNQKIVVGGFSQGAHVVGDVAQANGLNSKVVAVNLFGDPRFNESDSATARVVGTKDGNDGILRVVDEIGRRPAYASAVRARIRSFCIEGDPICDWISAAWATHNGGQEYPNRMLITWFDVMREAIPSSLKSEGTHAPNFVELFLDGIPQADFGCASTLGINACTNTTVNRAELASVLAQAIGLSPDGDLKKPDGTKFTDVSDSSRHAKWIYSIATKGITVGCNPPTNSQYCPTRDLRRDEMATFLVRAFGIPKAPASYANPFTDVTSSNVHYNNIRAIAYHGLTAGCNPPTNNKYCPADTVTVGQLSTFLVRSRNKF